MSPFHITNDSCSPLMGANDVNLLSCSAACSSDRVERFAHHDSTESVVCWYVRETQERQRSSNVAESNSARYGATFRA